MSRPPAQHLVEALEHLAILRQHVERHGVDDDVVVDACALRLSAAIEAVRRLPVSMVHEHLDDAEWRAIKGMRNRIAHAYAFVDPAVVRTTLLDDVAPFQRKIQLMLDGRGSDAQR